MILPGVGIGQDGLWRLCLCFLVVEMAGAAVGLAEQPRPGQGSVVERELGRGSAGGAADSRAPRARPPDLTCSASEQELPELLKLGPAPGACAVTQGWEQQGNSMLPSAFPKSTFP